MPFRGVKSSGINNIKKITIISQADMTERTSVDQMSSSRRSENYLLIGPELAKIRESCAAEAVSRSCATFGRF